MECENLILNNTLDLSEEGENLNLSNAFVNEMCDHWFRTVNSPHFAYIDEDGNCKLIGYNSNTDTPAFNCLISQLGTTSGYMEGIGQSINFIGDGYNSYSISVEVSELSNYCIENNGIAHIVLAAGNNFKDSGSGNQTEIPPIIPGNNVEIISEFDVAVNETVLHFAPPFTPENDISDFQILNTSIVNGGSSISVNDVNVTCVTTSLEDLFFNTVSNTVDFSYANASNYNYVSHLWTFGDGTTSTEENPTHIYGAFGTYEVSLEIVDENGCCSVLCKDITIVQEGCNFALTLTGNNNISNLKSALGLNSTAALASATSLVGIDGTFEIEEDAIFGPNLNFFLTQGSKIIVNSNIKMTKNGGFIGPCDTDFEGIIVNDGATLDITNVRLWGAKTAIKLEVNSILKSTNCIVEDSGFGIYLDGQGTIPTFTGNTVRNCDFGINAENTYELNITKPNDFINCGMGIRYWKTGGSITNNNFQGCNFGIFLHKSPITSGIRKNTINAIETGIAVIKHFENVAITQNDIGVGIAPPNYGVYSEKSSITIDNNISIKASYRGIAAYSPVKLYVSYNDLITVNSNAWNGSGCYGIYVFNDVEGDIGTNKISGYMENNIYCISCSETTIFNSEILSGATGHSIVMEAGVGSNISLNNILNEPIKGIGLYSHSGASILHNSVRASNTGLFINNLSQTQSIGCNDFQEGNKDIVTRAVLGIQYHHDNQFRKVGSRAFTEGLSPTQVTQSTFIVDDCTASNPTCDRPEQWFRPEFFRILDYDSDFPSDFPTNCGDNGDGSEPNDTGVNPPNPGPGDDYWCWLFSQFESTQNTNPLKSWVLRYKALKLNSMKPFRMISEDCIPYNDFYCNMDEFIDIESSVKDLRKDVGLGNISYEMMETGIENRISDLDVLDCNNYILRLYRNIYRTLLKDMIEEELNSDEIVELRDVAQLCAHMYGDVVYWARGILDHRGETVTYEDVTCESEWSEDPKSRGNSGYAIDQILVRPNPASNHIILENKTDFDVLQVKVTDSFGRVHVVLKNLEGQLNIDCSSYSTGIYFITFTHSSGYHMVKKVIITN